MGPQKFPVRATEHSRRSAGLDCGAIWFDLFQVQDGRTTLLAMTVARHRPRVFDGYRAPWSSTAAGECSGSGDARLYPYLQFQGFQIQIPNLLRSSTLPLVVLADLQRIRQTHWRSGRVCSGLAGRAGADEKIRVMTMIGPSGSRRDSSKRIEISSASPKRHGLRFARLRVAMIRSVW